MHQPRDHRKQWASALAQPECLPYLRCVGLAALPLVHAEVRIQVLVGARVPAGVDAVDDAGERALGGAPGQQPVQAAALCRAGDLLGVADADRVDVVGVDDATAQERHLPVELQLGHPLGGDAQRGGHRIRHQALVGQVMDGQQARRGAAGPAHIAGRQRARPVVQMQQARLPAQAGMAGRDLRGGMRQGGKANRVVFELRTAGAHIGRAVALEQFLGQQDVDRQPVRLHDAADVAGRQRGMRQHATNDLHLACALEHGTVAGNQHADVVAVAQRARQRGRHVAQPASLDEVRHFRHHEQGAARVCQRDRQALVVADEAATRITRPPALLQSREQRTAL